MRVFRDIQSRAPSLHGPRVPQLPWLYTPTPNGFERCMRAWVHLPMDDVTMHGTRARVQPTLLDATIARGVSSEGSEA
jgi:hypothetical protein